MKKLLTAILTAIFAVGMCLGFVGCDDSQPGNLPVSYWKTYCGVVQTIENNEGLFVYIPEVGVCDLPSYEDEKQQNITIKEGDLLSMDFEAKEVEFTEGYPVGIKTPVHTMTVYQENVDLKQIEKDYILTIDYTKDMEEEFLAYEKNLWDTVYFLGSKYEAGTDNSVGEVKTYEYCAATIEDIGNQRLTLRLNPGVYTIQDFLRNVAMRSIRLAAEFSSDAQQLVDFFDLRSTLTVADIEKIETVEYAGCISPADRQPTEYKTSQSQEDIQIVYDWLINLNKTLTEVPEHETYVEGGGEKILTVYTKLGNFKIRESARNYLHIWGKHFAQKGKMPDIAGENITYRFDYSTDETLNFYKWGGFSRMYEIKLSDIEFKICQDYLDMIDIGFTLEQDVGEIKLYSSKIFYHVGTGTYYEIVGETDFSIIFTTNESLSEKDLQNIQTLKTKYEEIDDPRNNKAYVVNYYGEYASGAIVAMMTRDDMGYDDAMWTETIAGSAITYRNGNRILVLYNGEFYNLTQAYESGYLTEEDIATIAMKHLIFEYYGLIDGEIQC